MIPNLKKHMKSTANRKNKHRNLFLIIAVLFFATASTGFCQNFKTGVYDLGDFVVNENELYGYIYDQIGDGELAPIRSCVAYITGEINKNYIKVYFWEVENNYQIKKYSGFIEERKNRKGKYDINFKKTSNYGICSESTFSKDASGNYSNSFTFREEKKHWKKIVLIKSENASIYQSSNQNSAKISAVKYLDGIIVIDENEDFYKVEVGSMIGWIKKSDTFPLKSENASIQKIKVVSEKSFFYHSPMETTIRKAYLIKGDQGLLKEIKGDWLFVEYQGKKVITGWMRKRDVEISK